MDKNIEKIIRTILNKWVYQTGIKFLNKYTSILDVLYYFFKN